ncbi:MAG TPA: hypothetical protein VFT08_10225 [Pyrinomonadaceae bacterium]|nr:hypothetical protein [Pyrinomonadaceae bacterium]
MKTQLIKLIPRIALLSALVILASAVSADAQSLANKARFTIPFDFAVGEKQLPAGKYAIGRAAQSSNDIMMSLSDDKGHSKAIVLSTAVMKLDSAKNNTLVFHRYGDQYFLFQVWAAGAETGREFPTSRLEREMKKQGHLAIVRIRTGR